MYGVFDAFSLRMATEINADISGYHGYRLHEDGG